MYRIPALVAAADGALLAFAEGCVSPGSYTVPHRQLVLPLPYNACLLFRGPVRTHYDACTAHAIHELSHPRPSLP